MGVTGTRTVDTRLVRRDTGSQIRTSLVSLFGRVRRLGSTVGTCSIPLVCHSLSLLGRTLARKRVSLVRCFIRARDVCGGLRTCVRVRGRCRGIVTGVCGGGL